MELKLNFLDRLNTYLENLVGLDNTKLALDIEPNSVILLNLCGSKNKPELSHFAITKLNEASLVDEHVRNAKDLINAISESCAQVPSKSNHVSIAAPGSLVISKNVSLKETLQEDEVESTAWAEARKAFPGLVDNLYLDYSLQTDNKLLLVAARKKELEDRLNAIAQSGLMTKVIDIDYYCLARAYCLVSKQLPDEHIDQYIGLVNIDTNAVLLSVINKKTMAYYHRQSYNGNLLGKVVSKTCHLLADEEAVSTEETLKTEQKELLQAQVKRLLQFFTTEMPGKTLSHLVISGRVATIPGVDKLIEEATQINTQLADPIASLKRHSSLNENISKLSPALMISAGLALRGLN